MISFRIHIYCRQNKKYSEKSALRFKVRYKGWEDKPLETTLPWKIDSKMWNSDKEELKVPSRSTYFMELNKINQDIQDFRQSVNRYCITESPSKRELVLFIEEYFGRSKNEKKNSKIPASLIEAGSDFIESSMGSLAIETIKNHQTSLRVLREFSKAHPEVSIRFENLTEKFATLYKSWAITIKNEFSDNYIATQLKCYNRWMSFFKNSYKIDVSFKPFKIKYHASKNNITLSEEEVWILYNHQCKSDGEDRAKKEFLRSCDTALRYGDASDHSKLQIEDGMLTTVMKKTNKRVCVPITKRALPLFKDIQNQKSFGDQVLNRYIKKIAKDAGIDAEVVRYIPGTDKAVRVPKYSMITMHTARRTFATLARLYDPPLPLDIISDLLGHSSLEQTQVYISVTSQQLAEHARSHPFFKR